MCCQYICTDSTNVVACHTAKQQGTAHAKVNSDAIIVSYIFVTISKEIFLFAVCLTDRRGHMGSTPAFGAGDLRFKILPT